MFNKKPKKDVGIKNHNFVDTIVKGWFWFKSLSFVKHIFMFYLLITLVGSLLLWGDFSQQDGVSIDYTDAVFTAASAFSDTGLTSITVATSLSTFGQTVLALLIFVGGLGWFALKVYFVNILFGKPMVFSTRDALSSERGSGNIGITKSLIRVAVTILLIVIVIASVALSLYFYYSPIADVDRYTTLHNGDAISNFGDNSKHYNIFTTENYRNNNYIVNEDELNKMKIDQANFVPQGNLALSVKYGIFHSISAINNAGFDIIGGESIAGYYNGYGLQIMFILLFILGGVGYPVIYDTYKKTMSIFTKEKYKFSLFSKISMLSYVVITTVSLVIIFSLEITTTNEERLINDTKVVYKSFWDDGIYGSHGNKLMALFFNTMSTRNAGFSTINMGVLSHGTLVSYSIFMFIGSAPSSTAGGIRTTTIAIIFLGLWTRIVGKTSVRAFNRRIPTDTVKNSYIVFTTALMIIIITSLICVSSLATHGGLLNAVSKQADGQYVANINPITGQPYNFTEIFFEVSSAFGTTGLSAGITSSLSVSSKVFLIFVMFIGQLGVSSSILVWTKKNPKKRRYSLVKEDVPIG